MNQPRWKLLYESLIDPQKGPQHILANWNGPMSLLRRALASKRLREKLAMHQELALAKCRYALLAAASGLAGNLQAAMSGGGYDLQKVAGLIDGLEKIKRLMEQDWAGHVDFELVGHVDFDAEGEKSTCRASATSGHTEHCLQANSATQEVGHVDFAAEGEKSTCRASQRLDPDLSHGPEISPAVDANEPQIATPGHTEHCLQANSATQDARPAAAVPLDEQPAAAGQASGTPADAAAPAGPYTVTLPDGLTCTPEEARWVKKWRKQHWTRMILLERENRRKAAQERAKKESLAAQDRTRNSASVGTAA